MRNVLIKIIRDNEIANWVGRRVVKFLVMAVKPWNKLALIYRIYGTFKLKVCDVELKAMVKPMTILQMTFIIIVDMSTANYAC